MMQFEHTIGHHTYDDQFQIPIVRSSLTRTFPSQFGEVSDEIKHACGTFLDAGFDGKLHHIRREK